MQQKAAPLYSTPKVLKGTIAYREEPSPGLKRSLQKLLELVTMLEQFRLSAQARNRMKKPALYLYPFHQ
jgi:hypothetical protein